MIYLDNAATTFKKPKSVYKAVDECIKKCSANAGRGGHLASLLAAEKIYSAREEICDFFSFSSPENVVFTLNATYALNMAIKGLVSERCHIIISDVEHNSVLRPIHKLTETIGIEYSSFNSKATSLELEIERHIRPNTRFIISTLASNVDGREIPIEILDRVAKRNNIKLIIDASQYAGHKQINLSKTPCSAFCAPAHKGLFGICGLGFVIFGESKNINTLVEGGSGNYSKSIYMPSLLPERLEGGTLPTPAIVALREGIRFIKSVGIEEIKEKNDKLTERTLDMLLSIPGVIFYGRGFGILSFNLKGYPSERVSALLDEDGICVRGGFHCAPIAHEALGTSENGTVRISTSYFSTEREIYRLYRALKKIKSKTKMELHI